MVEEDRNAAIVEDFKAGMPYTHIGRAYGIPAKRVQKILANEIKARNLTYRGFHFEQHHMRHLLKYGPYPPWSYWDIRLGGDAAVASKVHLVFNEQPSDEEFAPYCGDART